MASWVFDWAISLRSDTLTSFFKIFPFLATDSFYILVIAAGYWRNPRNRLFWDLGFLVPFSTVFNCTLKNLFAIPRPPLVFHLIPIREPFGFPSGDVQVAVIFWGMLCLSWRSLGFSFVSIVLIATMMVSRLYLGVHSFYDVIGGLFFGGITLWIYRTSFCQSSVSSWFSGKSQTYWGFIFTCAAAYAIVSLAYEPTPMIIAAFGALIGYGFFLETLPFKPGTREKTSPLLILASLGILFIIAFLIPVIQDGSKVLFWGTGLIKYSLLAFLIFSLLPHLQMWVSKR